MDYLGGILKGLQFLAAGLGLLGAFVFLYEKFTPYREFEMIRAGNVAAAISLGGAMIGVAIPIALAIHATHHYQDLLIWGGIGCFVQFVVFIFLRRFASGIEQNNIAVAILLASCSIATGFISGMSMT